MCGIWLCENLYNHYTFNNDIEYLRNRAYPIMKDAAEFALDWLIEDPKSRYLVTAPSTSPENPYFLPNGDQCAVTIASAADMSLIWELFKNTIEASRLLGVDEEFRKKMEKAQSRLYPLKIGSKGQLLEWYDEYPEVEPDHRHASHLVSLAWGTRITKRGTPELFKAARKSLKMRGQGGGMPAKFAQIARLEDGKMAYQNLRTSLDFPMLFVQSFNNEIHLLSSLPPEWTEGYVRGIKARGGYTVDVEWQDNRFIKAVIHSKDGGTCRIRTPVTVNIHSNGKRLKVKYLDIWNLVEFETEPGQVYEVIQYWNPPRLFGGSER